MRIAQIAPLHESVPPKLYGGTERVVAYLCDALTDLGHDVVLFASGDSTARAELEPIVPRALRLDPATCDEVAPHVFMMERVMQRAHEFDVLHFHVDHLHFPLVRRQETPHLTTLHGRLDLPYLREIYAEFCDIPLVSISDAQRAPLPDAAWRATVQHGLPLELLRPGAGDGGYFVFLGRISTEKRVDRAIAIAKRLGAPLKIAAKIGKPDRAYHEREIAPLLDDPLVEFLGEIPESEKSELLGGARALLFPIDWPEPFGLAMIEAMACGTPVVAWRCGSVPEVVDEGVTGFVVDDLDEAVRAARACERLDREVIRATFERRFSAERMARDYVALYEALATDRSAEATRPRRDGGLVAAAE